MADETCGAFRRIDKELDRSRIHRFIVGENGGPEAMSADAAAAELDDPFARHLLLKGQIPRTALELLEMLDQATDADDPLRNELVFLLGEGSQIPLAQAPAALDRGLRFLIARGNKNLPDLIVSAAHPNREFVEVMAWDQRSLGFNYYQSVGPTVAWVWAGNSRHALADPTRGKGPFESHLTGNFVMKELKAPWVHWQSFDASIPTDVVFTEDELDEVRPWLDKLDEPRGGAFTCEMCVARPSVRRWTAARFDGLPVPGNPDHAMRVIEQILVTSTANLISTRIRSSSAIQAEEVPLPNTFFVDEDALKVLGLAQPLARGSAEDPEAAFAVRGKDYAAALDEFGVALRDDKSFEQAGDTFFAFVVPERAFEDTAALAEAVEREIIPRDLAAALLMVDFTNPVFSSRRASLLKGVPDDVTIDTLAEQLEANIFEAAESTPEDSPEREFAALRSAGESFEEQFNEKLGAYYEAVAARLSTAGGFNDFFRLAEGRRFRFREMPIFEVPILLADTNLDSSDVVDLMMMPDATVQARPSPPD